MTSPSALDLPIADLDISVIASMMWRGRIAACVNKA